MSDGMNDFFADVRKFDASIEYAKKYGLDMEVKADILSALKLGKELELDTAISTAFYNWDIV